MFHVKLPVCTGSYKISPGIDRQLFHVKQFELIS